MAEKIRCQSCGMALGEFTNHEGELVSNWGTESDGQLTHEYCALCYRDGSFTQPDIKLKDMIALSIENMTKDLLLPLDKAKQLANDIIPHLKRWQP